MDFFKKVLVNVSLLDVIKQLPGYAKFLKEICTTKKKLKGNETVKVNENVLDVLKKYCPQNTKIQVYLLLLASRGIFQCHMSC